MAVTTGEMVASFVVGGVIAALWWHALAIRALQQRLNAVSLYQFEAELAAKRRPPR